MKEKPIGKASAKAEKTDWISLRRKTTKAIRTGIEADADVHATDVGFWKQAMVVIPHPKQTVTIRLDADLLGWLRRQKGYQTRINAVLRTYMEANKP